MELTIEKRAELLDRIRDGKKVKIKWLATVCMLSVEEILEVANDYKLFIDKDNFIYAPEDEDLKDKIDDEIDKTEKEELLNYLRQPTYLEYSLNHSEIIKLESLFNSDGFIFKRNRKGIVLHDILTIDKNGLKVINGNSTLCNIKWSDMKNIRLTSKKEKDYKKKSNWLNNLKVATIFSFYQELYGARGIRYALNTVDEQDANHTRIVTTIKTFNMILISSEKQKDILLNTSGFKLTKKVSLPKELDGLVYILEHFFHKTKREQLIHN